MRPSLELEQLQTQAGVTWPQIVAARDATEERRAELAERLKGLGTADAALVAFGSLARQEWTGGSDLDWSLLVNGPAKRDQMSTVHQVRQALSDADIKGPNSAGAFGSMASSHELVHRIGGDSDTNRITTQRVLLLLESAPLLPSEARVHQAVLAEVLNSYLGDDVVTRDCVPHVLLNDVVRYWRTMTVDFRAKTRERGDKGWAIRNLKLRTSRKLIFTSGLVMCLGHHVQINQGQLTAPADTNERRAQLLAHLIASAHRTPLDIVAGVALTHPGMQTLVVPVLTEYDRFLGLVNDPTKRTRLEELSREASESDETYEAARDVGRGFGSALQSLFFDSQSVFVDAIQKYGVF
jgi:predicted nucleotidyltransferase